MFTRRQFIATLAAGAASALLPLSLAAAAVAPKAGRRLILGSMQNVCVFDADSFALIKKVDLGFLPHSFVRHPTLPDRIWAIQRMAANTENKILPGKDTGIIPHFRAAEVDIVRGEKTREIVSQEGELFFGHGFFLPGTEILFISQVDFIGNSSHLVGYDINTGKIVADHFVAIGGLHESKLAADGTALIATSGIGHLPKSSFAKPVHRRFAKASIQRLDLTTGKIVSVSPIEDEAQMLAHFEVLPDGRFIGVSRPVVVENNTPGPTGGIYIGREGGLLESVAFKEEVPGKVLESETFSIAINQKRGFAAISDYGNKVILQVDIEKASYLRQLRTDVFGVAFDAKREEFIVYGNGITRMDGDMANKLPAHSTVKAVDNQFNGTHALII